MKKQDCDFTTAVRELREMLLVEDLGMEEMGETTVEMGERRHSPSVDNRC